MSSQTSTDTSPSRRPSSAYAYGPPRSGSFGSDASQPSTSLRVPSGSRSTPRRASVHESYTQTAAGAGVGSGPAGVPMRRQRSRTGSFRGHQRPLSGAGGASSTRRAGASASVSPAMRPRSMSLLPVRRPRRSGDSASDVEADIDGEYSGLSASEYYQSGYDTMVDEAEDDVLNVPQLEDSEQGISLLHTLDLPKVKCIAFSTGGSTLAVGCTDAKVRLFDTASGTLERTLRGHLKEVRACAFSPGGSQLATTSADGSIRLWEPKSGKELKVLDGHNSRPVWSVGYSSSGHLLVSGGFDECIRVWNARTGALIDFFQEGFGHPIVTSAISPKETLLAEASFDGLVRLWDIGRGTRVWRKLESIAEAEKKRRREEMAKRSGQQALREAKDRARERKFAFFQAMAGKKEEKQKVRSESPMGTARSMLTLRGHSGAVSSVCFMPTGDRLASSSHDKTLRIWNPLTGECLHVLDSASSSAVWTCQFSADSSLLAAGMGEGVVDLYDAANSSSLLRFQGHDGYINSCAFSRDGLVLATGADDERVRIWRLLGVADLRRRKEQLDEARRELAESQRRLQEEHERAQERLDADLADIDGGYVGLDDILDLEDRDADARSSTSAVRDWLTPSDAGSGAISGDLDIDDARILALRELMGLRQKDLQREQAVVHAIDRATANEQAKQDAASRDHLRRLAARRNRERFGLPAWGLDAETDHNLDYLTSLRQRRAELYAKVGRAEIADRSFHLETAQLHPEDLDRQREFESWAQSRLDLKIFDI